MTPDMCRSTMGLRVDEVVAHWYEVIGWEGRSVPEVTASIVERMAHLIRTEGRLLPGVGESLALLRRDGMKIGLASSSWTVLIDAVLDACSLRGSFDVVRSAADEPKGKPDPGVYLSTASALGSDPSRCLAIEDSPNGVEAAKAAGMFCVGIPGEPGVDLGRADVILDHLEAFPGFWERVRTPSTS